MTKIDLRHSSNDPSYERIKALREYRSKNFWANVLIWLGILTLVAYGIGLIFLIWGIVKKIKARHIRVKYRE